MVHIGLVIQLKLSWFMWSNTLTYSTCFTLTQNIKYTCCLQTRYSNLSMVIVFGSTVMYPGHLPEGSVVKRKNILGLPIHWIRVRNKQTPRKRIISENMIYSLFYMETKKSSSSQQNFKSASQFFTLHICNINFNIFLHFNFLYTKWSVPLRFSDQIFVLIAQQRVK
jgi:hypothetical protein